MADEEAAQGPLVKVSFQRNVHRNQKYLEAEPKALGVTQIGLSAYQIVCIAVLLAKGLTELNIDIAFFISSLLVVIAGSVAVGAQNLHLPTMKACLGMQIVACVASIFNMICILLKMGDMPIYCWHYDYDNSTLHYGELCNTIEHIHYHFFVEGVVIQVALIAISVTLAIYCSKVVNCCTPTPKMTVVTVQAPPIQQ